MSDSKGKLRHIPARVLGMHRKEEQVAPQHGSPVGASLRSRTLRELCPGLLLAVTWSQSRVSHAGRESVVFRSSPWPQKHLPPAGPLGHTCREPACPSGVQALTCCCPAAASSAH